LTVRNGSIQFRDFTDSKYSFVVSVSDVCSVERRSGPEGFRALRMELSNGKKVELVPERFGHVFASEDKKSLKG